jgi:hypothetical protein
LSKDPEDRYQTAKDLLSELRRVKRESDSDVSTIIGVASATPLKRPGKSWLLAGIVATLAILAGIFILESTEFSDGIVIALL